MSEPKHTPGPWLAVHNFYCDGDSDVETYRIRPAGWKNGEIAHTVMTGTYVDSRANLANAHLMAAAPCLLEALKQAVSACPCSIGERLSGHRHDCPAPGWQGIIRQAEGQP